MIEVLLLAILGVLCLILRRMSAILNECERIDEWTCDILRKVDPDNLYVSGRR